MTTTPSLMQSDESCQVPALEPSVPFGSSERTMRSSHFTPVCSLSKCPRRHVARRNPTLSDSIAFLAGRTWLETWTRCRCP